MSAIHCPRQPDMAAFLLGALTPAEERAAMAHVAGCRNCHETLAEFIQIPSLLARVPRSTVEMIEHSRSRTAPRR